jgi:hypothetical protein
MLEEAQEVVIREVWDIRKPVGAAGRKRQQGKGVDEQTPRESMGPWRTSTTEQREP